MNQFEKFGNQPIHHAIDGLDLEMLTQELVKSGEAGSKKVDQNEGHDFAREGAQRIAQRSNKNQENRI